MLRFTSRRVSSVALSFALTAGGAYAIDFQRILFGEMEPDALVVTDMTPAGKERPLPTAEKPVYYYYRAGGYRELGVVVAGEKKPEAEKIAELLTTTLAKQHYLRATRDSPPPTIMLTAWWGSINPDISEDVDDTDGVVETTIHNGKDVMMIVGDNKFADRSWITGDRERVREEALTGRYFLFVATYDLEALVVRKEKKPLWFTRVSLPSDGTNLPESLWSLIVSAGPYYGKDTGKVKFIDPAKIRKTEVNVGEVREIPAEKTPPAPVTPPAEP